MGHQRNQRRNKELPRDKWKKKQNISKSRGAAKAILRGEFIVIQAHLKKKKGKKSLLTLQLKELEKEQSQVLIKGRK